MFFVISSTLKGFTFRIPPSALLHPENSERITLALLERLRSFLTAINSRGGRHYPSLNVVINKTFEAAHSPILCSGDRSYS